jgi:hypothetical protein
MDQSFFYKYMHSCIQNHIFISIIHSHNITQHKVILKQFYFACS